MRPHVPYEKSIVAHHFLFPVEICRIRKSRLKPYLVSISPSQTTEPSTEGNKLPFNGRLPDPPQISATSTSIIRPTVAFLGQVRSRSVSSFPRRLVKCWKLPSAGSSLTDLIGVASKQKVNAGLIVGSLLPCLCFECLQSLYSVGTWTSTCEL